MMSLKIYYKLELSVAEPSFYKAVNATLFTVTE